MQSLYSLGQLRQALPGFGPTETLLKVVAVNALYGTNVLALMRAAKHVEQVLGSVDFAQTSARLWPLFSTSRSCSFC